MMDAASDEKIMKLLFEVEQLQRTLNQERQEHAEQLKDLQVSNGIKHNIFYCFIKIYFCRKKLNLIVILNKLNYTKKN